MIPVVASSAYDYLRVFVAESRGQLGASAANEASHQLKQAISAKGAARVVLASAPSQNELLDAFVVSDVDWSRVTIFHMDEYVGIPADHPATFRAYQRKHVLSRIKPAAFHGIQGEASDPAAECARYAALLREAPIDLVCLGIGENGHLAFNDPPVADFQDPDWVKPVELDALCRRQQVNDGCFPDLASVPLKALTLTIPALLSARAIVGAVPGPRKADAVRNTLKGPISTACPASILRRHSNAALYLDRESAALL
jgi:glucosamine-6-phosphate deaminase